MLKRQSYAAYYTASHIMRRYKVMKGVLWIKILILGLLVSLFSCTGDEQCKTGLVDIKDLEDLGCLNTTNTLIVNTVNEFAFIRNQEDYEIHIEGSCNPEIDWLSYDLIAGMVRLNRGLATLDKRLTMNCASNRLTLTIDISLNITQVAPEISYNAIIPKLKDNQDFFVVVNIVN